ncbi:MAG TPA: hypothetical protein VHL11_10245 [Phototrophicaceae bacterium]|jgi:hypothetical protein|nr:hypothetical protein [Phototrophicaceae bacterium]
MSTPSRPSSLIKPTLDTKFHIDYDWWERTPGEDLRVYLLSHLPQEQHERFNHIDPASTVDYIDPETGEVLQLDELGLALQVAAEAPDFITGDTPLINSIFRVLLKNHNTPVSSRELAALTGRQAETILRLISGSQVYKGIRPYMGD